MSDFPKPEPIAIVGMAVLLPKAQNLHDYWKNILSARDCLSDVPDERRGARYLSHAAIADPTGTIRLTVEATCRGRIIREPRGSNGFGYDPYFLIPEYHLTFGELSSTVKQHLSHRARAFERLIVPLVRLLSSPVTP